MPLLEDLDIDVEMIKNNLKAVIFFKKFEHRFTEDPDMGGPLIVGFSLALALMLVRLRCNRLERQDHFRVHLRADHLRRTVHLLHHQPRPQEQLLHALWDYQRSGLQFVPPGDPVSDRGGRQPQVLLLTLTF